VVKSACSVFGGYFLYELWPISRPETSWPLRITFECWQGKCIEDFGRKNNFIQELGYFSHKLSFGELQNFQQPISWDVVHGPT
jgi:hypothetical protein